ncbi:hypothetical protein N783_18480 [Pontibacillus marinus BH030004 = DSM 16465]|uniref:Uncharacterized protein n=1 Tax=Pontibacillus marinus BH030004 = DSM 16465 TaxID=1385511 RepID=A0A0A5GFP1_9BACI|nr:hypothetical protein N783_18480 [Pontibacillus marinus BH030004 = DSM 16465]
MQKSLAFMKFKSNFLHNILSLLLISALIVPLFSEYIFNTFSENKLIYIGMTIWIIGVIVSLVYFMKRAIKKSNRIVVAVLMFMLMQFIFQLVVLFFHS